jgi:hypothetical protein
LTPFGDADCARPGPEAITIAIAVTQESASCRDISVLPLE